MSVLHRQRERWSLTLSVVALVLLMVLASCGADSSDVTSDAPSWSTPFDENGVISPPADWFLLTDAVGWNADGSRLAYHAHDSDLVGRVVLAEGGVSTPITSPDIDVASFAWMPDGQSLLVAESVEENGREHTPLVLVGLDGTIKREVSLERKIRVPYGIAVTLDGTRIYASGGGPGDADFDFSPSLLTVDLDSGDVDVLETAPGFDPSRPILISDTQLLYFANAVEGGNRNDHLEVLDLTTCESRPLTPLGHAVQAHAVFPGADAVVYHAFDWAEERHKLWRISLEPGSEPELLSGDSPVNAIAVHPDGTHAAIRRADPVESEQRPLLNRFYLCEIAQCDVAQSDQ